MHLPIYLALAVIGVSFTDATTYDAPTAAEINSMKSTLQSYFRSNATTFNFVPTAVRLAFHDCVGNKCDGCINLSNAANNGLSDAIDFLNVIYTDEGYDAIMSRADFWQTAAIAATEFAITRNNKNVGDDYQMPTDTMTVRWGREDCADSPTTTETHEFPEPTMGSTEMFNFFATNYGFSKDEVVALMGAHTLGGCDAVDSGYRGMWVLDEAIFMNTKYYDFLLADGVDVVNEAIDDHDRDGDGDKRWQWDLFNEGEYVEGSTDRVGIMLNTDMHLAWDIDNDKFDGTSCVIGSAVDGTQCSESDTVSTVEKYALDSTTWWTDYRAVFDKLGMHGYDSLDEVVLS